MSFNGFSKLAPPPPARVVCAYCGTRRKADQPSCLSCGASEARAVPAPNIAKPTELRLSPWQRAFLAKSGRRLRFW